MSYAGVIGAAELKVPILQVADFTVIDNRIFILDNTLGVFNVKFDGFISFDTVNLPLSEKYWGIDVTDVEEEYYI